MWVGQENFTIWSNYTGQIKYTEDSGNVFSKN
nr:MAG TPA: hypothetical protein [Caudoviricetes sp.]